MTDQYVDGAALLASPTTGPDLDAARLHPDSEEAVRNDRHRTAEELTPLNDHNDENSERIQRGGPSASQPPHWYDSVTKFWKAQVCITIDEGAHRDHLALERTFLGYLRTSLMLAMSGVLVVQLFRLQHALHPHPRIGFFVSGTPVAATFIGLAIAVLLAGALRFWRQQNAMVRGKVHAGGWEIVGVMGASLLLCTGLFGVVLAVDLHKSYFDRADWMPGVPQDA